MYIRATQLDCILGRQTKNLTPNIHPLQGNYQFFEVESNIESVCFCPSHFANNKPRFQNLKIKTQSLADTSQDHRPKKFKDSSNMSCYLQCPSQSSPCMRMKVNCLCPCLYPLQTPLEKLAVTVYDNPGFNIL